MPAEYSTGLGKNTGRQKVSMCNVPINLQN